MRRFALFAAALFSVACSKKEPPPPERTEPWLANPPEASAALSAKYVWSERCEAKLTLRAKEGSPRGVFRVCRGELDVNLTDLTESRGTLAIDVASIEIRGDGDAGRDAEQSQEAQNWMDVGASRPEAERERLRWAIFTLTALRDASSASAHTGKRERVEPEPEEPADLPEDDAGEPKKSERRSVTLVARGQLVLHQVRVDVEVPIRVSFHYAERASADTVPERLTLTTRRPVVVSLAAHQIKPRDSSGVFQAQAMKLLGQQVGSEAKVSLFATGTVKSP
ncbi:MAG: hypothetical protein IPI67_11345 [Myxococcales bacterium]|nr:hypothetical protein [Myxococcales bacterium]